MAAQAKTKNETGKKTAGKKGTDKRTIGKAIEKKETGGKVSGKKGAGKQEVRLKTRYREKIVKAMMEEFSYHSVMQVPKLEKIVLSMGVGEAVRNSKLLDSAVKELTQITGLQAVRTKAKKSISNFKLRQGMEIGAMVTLRGRYMYEFFDRLVNVAIPRIKDFRGTSPNAFDGHGNYSLGVQEQIIFPEIDYDKIERITGLNIAIVTTAGTDGEARSLLTHLGMPFRK